MVILESVDDVEDVCVKVEVWVVRIDMFVYVMGVLVLLWVCLDDFLLVDEILKVCCIWVFCDFGSK